MTSRDFVCKACSNYCDIKEFTIEGQKSYWGDKCSDKFRKPSTTGRKPVIEDLFAYREKVIEELAAHPAPAAGPRLRVGIPRAMSTFDRYPFWHRYFTELGIEVGAVAADRPQDRRRRHRDWRWRSPATRCRWRTATRCRCSNQGVDYVLVPNMLNAESDESPACIAHFCPWNQTLPYVLRSAPQLEEHRHKFLSPTLHFQLGRERREEGPGGDACASWASRARPATGRSTRPTPRSASFQERAARGGPARAGDAGRDRRARAWCWSAAATTSTTATSTATSRGSCATTTAPT